METAAALKQMESTLSITYDRANAAHGKLEDLLFRAQRIAAAQKKGGLVVDTMFGYDLQNFRRDLRRFSGEISSIPVAMGSIERSATCDPHAAQLAMTVMRLATRLASLLRTFHETAILAHQHIRTADHKIEAWYLSQEIEQLVMFGQSLPTIANKILIITQTPPAKV